MTGDAARRDEDGYYWILGRVDDVMNVSGHRLSTMEIESALVRHPAVAEAAVVGKPHEITGQAVACFVTLKKGNWNHHELGEELRKWVAHEIGGFAKPEQIRFTDALPKTRSGKIMRRLLREIVTSNTVTGDVTTLEDLVGGDAPGGAARRGLRAASPSWRAACPIPECNNSLTPRSRTAELGECVSRSGLWSSLFQPHRPKMTLRPITRHLSNKSGSVR